VRLRAFKDAALIINGQQLSLARTGKKGWKEVYTVDASKLLRVGANEISVAVTNDLGPPALDLSLKMAADELATDKEWEASMADGVWVRAELASAPPAIRRGHQLFGLETMKESLRRAWPKLLAILLVAVAAWLVLERLDARQEPGSSRLSKATRNPIWVVVIISLFWVALFWNNLPQLPAKFGFDRNGHLCYIDYIRHNHKLPLADEEWETFQPPLYYLTSTVLLAPFQIPPDPAHVPWHQVSRLPEWHTNTALIGLRAFSAVIGLANVWLVFLCLRLLFPQRHGAQIIGTLLAAFVPPSIYLSHQITNEGLAGLFVTVVVYFCLRIVTPRREATEVKGKAWILNYAGLGVFLGLAMLTKFSALLVFPAIFGTLVWAGWRPVHAGVSPAPGLPGIRLRKIAMHLAAVVVPMLAVCYWHYERVWQHFGKPFVGNWDPMLPFHWWQDPGYRTGLWYWRVGESFVSPLFSGLFSFADGIYSSLWGDGYCSAGVRTRFRPPWDYDLMNAGYLLALVPAALVLAGLIIVTIRFLRRPKSTDFLLLTLLAACVGGIILMSLRVASYAQVKAFYALPALAGFCVLGAIGWEWLASRAPRWKPVLIVGFAAWLLTVCGTFWIRAGNPMTWTMRGIQSAQADRLSEAARYFRKALEIDPGYLPAHVGLTDVLGGMRELNAAFEEAQTATAQYPREEAPHNQLASLYQMAGDPTNALLHLQTARALAPDTEDIHRQLGACLTQLHRQREAAAAYEDGLKLHPLDSGLMSALAAILAGSPEAGFRDGQRAVRLAERACQLTEFRDPACLEVLAVAYSENGKFDQALAAAQAAQNKAAALGQTAIAERSRSMIEMFQAWQSRHQTNR
jgi:Flp pilus assembly protein TadD